MLEARGVGKRLGQREVLAGVDLAVAPGEVVALLGPNGAGKSTLVRVLATLTRPSAGEVRWEGRPVARQGEDYRRALGLVAHGTFLYGHLTARENLRFYARLYGVRDRGARVAEVLSLMGLAGVADEPVRSFSRGMQQRLAIARALLHRPRVLLLDEPFTGLDRAGRDTLADVLRRFRAAGGACLLVTHDFDQAAGLADRYAVLDRGRVAAAGACAGLTPEALAAAYAGALGGERAWSS